MKLGQNVAASMSAALAGAAVAASMDAFAARAELGRFLVQGTWRLWLFLTALYGAILALGLGLLVLLLLLLHRHTLLGVLLEVRSPPDPPMQISKAALGLGALTGLTLLGLTLYPLVLTALGRFHHRGLISLLLGATAIGLAILGAACGLGLAAAVSRIAPKLGGVCSVQFLATRSLYVLGWALGMAAVGVGVMLALPWFQEQPRMTPQQSALRLSLLAPTLALFGIGLGHFLSRMGRRYSSNRCLDSNFATLALPMLVLLLPMPIGAAVYWPALRIVDFRPVFTALILLGVGGLGFFALRARRLCTSRLFYVLPLVLYGTALHLGQSDRVRKAALTLAPLSEHLVLAIGRIFDLDRDGVPGRLAIGGTDCDDLNFDRHPGAFDWPDNGIDENCNGHDATLNSRGGHKTQTASDSSLLRNWHPAIALQPNIVLITIDALRADHVSAYGYTRQTTKALDALAADVDGVLFENAWAHAPSTRYSIPAILSGRYPSTIAWGSPQIHWPPEVLPENRLLAEMLAERGYSTTALLSYHYFERSWGLAQGFADYDTQLMTLHSLGGDPAATSGSSAREMADLALSKLAALLPQASTRPFFLWMHFYDPHYRYEAHPPPPGEASFGNNEEDLYDGEIRYTDQQIGRVLDALQKSGAWSKTAVMITADHGEGFGEHGIGPDRRHGYHLYANQTRVPLILRIPGLRTAQEGSAEPVSHRLQTPVGHVDLAPTLLHLASGRDPHREEPQLLGDSLLPILLAPEKKRDAVVFQEVMYEGPTVRKAVVSQRWHLLQNLIPDGTTELYDLQADPSENRDRFGEFSQIEADLGARLAAWMDDSAISADFAKRIAANLSQTPLNGAIPLKARIGDFLDVIAVDAPTTPIGRSQRAGVAVIYQVRRRIPDGYRLFAHLRSRSGPMLNLDHDFVDGLIAPPRLRPGMYVRDITRLALPAWFPAGPATLRIGLFQGNTRAEVFGPSGVALQKERAIDVATVDIR